MGNKYTDSRKYRGSTVEVRNDDFNRALRTFSKKVQESNMLDIVKENMSYEKPAVMRQRKKKQARKRWERQVEDMIQEGRWLKDKKY